MNQETIERCTQCPNQCLRDELQCGRGRRFFGEEKVEDQGKHHHGHHDKKDLTHLLMRCGFILDRKTSKQRGQGRILKLLIQYPQLTQKELQDKLEIEAGSLSETIAKLEARGLILREKDEADKRRMLVRLSAEGMKAASMEEEDNLDSLYDILSEEEKEMLQALLIKLCDKWSSDYYARGGRHHGPKGRHQEHHKSEHHKEEFNEIKE